MAKEKSEPKKAKAETGERKMKAKNQPEDVPPPEGKAPRPRADGGSSRLLERYKKKLPGPAEGVVSYSNPMAIPKVRKVVVNIGMGEATQNVKSWMRLRRT